MCLFRLKKTLFTPMAMHPNLQLELISFDSTNLPTRIRAGETK